MPQPLVRLALGAGIAALLIAAGPAAPLKHGRWKERIELTRMTLGEDILPFEAGENRVFTKYRCHKPGDGGAAGFFGPQMPDAQCGTVSGGIGGGRINLSARCNFGHGPADVTIIGTYTASSQASQVRMSTLGPEDKKMVMESKVDGTFEGPCRGDEEQAGTDQIR